MFLNNCCINSLVILLNTLLFYNELSSSRADSNAELTSYDIKKKNIWETDARLPEDVFPLHYNLLLHPNLENGTFYGEIDIAVNFSDEKNIIVLHSQGLTINDVHFSNSETCEVLNIKEQFPYEIHEFYIIILDKYVAPGKYELSMTYSGVLTNKIIGFYKSTYRDVVTGEIRQIATSKFEPTYARQAFPCFDEPSFKAEFTVQLVRPTGKNYIALSNMNEVEKETDKPQAGLTTVHFAKSVPMSTYLACFIICDFDHLDPVISKQGFPVTVYARPGQVKNMQYALDLAAKTIDYYVEYFGIKYPLPKLDLIAIPDFVSGAMEHWGLITFRETSVLYNEGTSSILNKKHVSFTIAHELAHMWFGNLVTMAWWNDLWLNEGFASFMEYKGVGHSHPDWDMDTQILTDEIHRVMSLDSVLSSHPIVQTVSHPDQITEIFDTISYSKGATIIRMLEDMMGPEAFQQGVSDYLKKFSYGNAETNDLWNMLEKHSNGINITQIMSTWTRQMGFPLVNVERSGNTLILTQQRFLADSNATFNKDESEFQYKWDIPLTYVTSVNPSHIHRDWFYTNQSSVTINLSPDTEWIKINYRQFGYYKVRYSTEDWQKLVNVLLQSPDSITAADRAHLLNDAFSLAKAGYIKYKIALSVIQYLPKEQHFVPWIEASHKLQFLQSILINTPVYMKFRKFIHKILDPVMTDSLWNISASSSYIERRQKLVALELSCSLKVPSCVNKAQEKFNFWLLKNGTKPEPELRTLIYSTGMSGSSEIVWERMWQAYITEEEPQEKVKLRNALAAVREPWLLNRLIDLAKDENYVRSQDFFFVLGSISDNPVGNPVVWDFIRDQWGYLVKRFTLNNRSLGTLLPRITNSFGTKTKLNELKAFLAANSDAGAGAAGRKIALERIENNIRWLSLHLSELSHIL